MQWYYCLIIAVIGQFFVGAGIAAHNGLNKATIKTRQQFAKLLAKAAGDGWLQRVLVAFDIFVNVIFGGREDETISSRVGRITDEYAGKTTWNPLVWVSRILNLWLDFIQPDHHQHAMVGDLERGEAVVKIEENALKEETNE